jgi:hypothetical protein
MPFFSGFTFSQRSVEGWKLIHCIMSQTFAKYTQTIEYGDTVIAYVVSLVMWCLCRCSCRVFAFVVKGMSFIPVSRAPKKFMPAVAAMVAALK